MSLPKFLQDRFFLKQLDALHIKQEYIKITVLNWKQQPIKQIQGIVINGNVNLDGSSSMRRTASLTIFAQEKDNNLANVDHLFSINKKCKVELGIVNTIPNYTFQIQQNGILENKTINYQHEYGEIVWFPLGIYVMFNPSLSHGIDGVQISMQLKDKMCLLNGDLGGQIHSSVQFSSQDEVVDYNGLSLEKNPVLIYNIIRQLVNHWGNEQLSKIIISEVPLQIKSVVKWTGESDIYLIQNDADHYTLSTSPPETTGAAATCYSKFQDIGFKYDAFVYPGELICNAGETVTNVLDKIINILGNYEYFYDVEGNFIFQEKQNYLNMTNTAYWTKEQDNKTANLPTQVYQGDSYRLNKTVYNFTHNEYTTAYNNSLNYNNLKNDFVVWGVRPKKSNTQVEECPCRFHLAIDKKPQSQVHNNILFYKDESDIVRGKGLLDSDILYSKTPVSIVASQKDISLAQEEITIYKNGYGILKNSASSLDQGKILWNTFIQNNANEIDQWEQNFNMEYLFININNTYYTSNFYWINSIKETFQFIPITVFEKIVNNTLQISSFEFYPWFFYGPSSKIELDNSGKIISASPGGINSTYFPNNVIKIQSVFSKDWREQIYYQMLESEKLGTDENTELNNSYFQYYPEIKEQFPKIYDLQNQTWKDEILYSPQNINYYLDFIDDDSQLGQYSVNNIGRRAKIVDESNQINCVFEPFIPDIVYVDPSNMETEEYQSLIDRLTRYGQVWTQIPYQLSSLFSQGGVLNSCFEKIKDLLYQYTHFNNTISITTLPIYYLEPNTRITVEDDPAGIYGDYIIQSISLPLDVSSTMTINAYRAQQKI